MNMPYPQYGKDLLHNYRLDTSTETLPILATRSLQGPQIAALHIKIGPEQLGLTKRALPEDTFAAGVSITGVSNREVWSKGRLVLKQGFAPDSLRIGHLGDELHSRFIEPYEAVAFLIRRASLDAFTYEEGYRQVANLSCPYGIVDPALAHLTRTLLPFFEQPQEASPIFVDHVGLAITAHLVNRYGDHIPSAGTMAKGGLTPAHTRRVQEMLAGDLKGNLLIADIAHECGISRQHLIKAFKKTTGYTPHQWLQWKRTDQAKDMLKRTKMPISDIALQCGFADQSHLTKVFTTLVRTTPAVWRQQNQSQTRESIPN
ncbi:MAG: AraC family transcriptional regulator [Acidobacteriaceae bacterium]|nr:AraC family transcriptional regulator [Acidobacteriaceae bacterium]